MSGSPVPPTPGEAPRDDLAVRAFRFGSLSGYPFKKRMAIRAISAGMTGLLHVIGRTMRYDIEGREHWEAASQPGRLAIFTFWHESIALATFPFRSRNIIVMSSLSFDAEYTARTVQRFGYGVVRGSSTRGGVGALIEMIRLMRAGYPAAFTIDGPKGPRHVAKMGPLLLAKKTGHPIVPAALTASRHWTLSRSWDRTVIPKPFSRGLVVFGLPIAVEADADEPTMEVKLQELQGRLDALEQRARLWREEWNSLSWWRRSRPQPGAAQPEAPPDRDAPNKAA